MEPTNYIAITSKIVIALNEPLRILASAMFLWRGNLELRSFRHEIAAVTLFLRNDRF